MKKQERQQFAARTKGHATTMAVFVREDVPAGYWREGK